MALAGRPESAGHRRRDGTQVPRLPDRQKTPRLPAIEDAVRRRLFGQGRRGGPRADHSVFHGASAVYIRPVRCRGWTRKMVDRLKCDSCSRRAPSGVSVHPLSGPELYAPLLCRRAILAGAAAGQDYLAKQTARRFQNRLQLAIVLCLPQFENCERGSRRGINQMQAQKFSRLPPFWWCGR